MEWIEQHKLLFGIFVVVLIGTVWTWLSGSKTDTALLSTVTTTSSGSPTQENADQQLVATLLALRSVSLSGTIFQDPAFQSLHDFGTAIVAEPQGRPNPFAPLNAPSAPPSTATTQSGSAGKATPTR